MDNAQRLLALPAAGELWGGADVPSAVSTVDQGVGSRNDDFDPLATPWYRHGVTTLSG